MSEKPEDREQKTPASPQEGGRGLAKGGENTKHSTQTASRLILLIAVVIAVCVFIVRNFGVSRNIILVLLARGGHFNS